MVLDLAHGSATATLPRMTYKEYLAWAVGHPHSEWVEGEVIEFRSVTARYALVVGFLIQVFGAFVRHRQLGVLVGDP
jgi:hypothetical protein